MALLVLVLNAGSSTQKSSLYRLNPDDTELLWEAHIDWVNLQLTAKNKAGQKVALTLATDQRPLAFQQMLTLLWEGETAVLANRQELNIAGHRVVHGGEHYREPVLVTEEVKAKIGELSVLAPVHNPAALEGIEAVTTSFGNIPQVAVFDTAFHRTLPPAAAIYPGPYAWIEQGICRYGFHGINHQYCAERTSELLGAIPENLITCHLGNGCSLAAIKVGKSIDTTMGFTPLEGLMMGTRSGTIDPGLLLYLLAQHSYTPQSLTHLLNYESGLKGISGISGDFRLLQTAMSEGNSRAQLAFDIYIHRLAGAVGAMLTSLGGLDILVFTGGVGEHVPLVRSALCNKLSFLGLKLDLTQNMHPSSHENIATPDSTVQIFVIPAQEDWAIAQVCRHIVKE